MYVCTVRMYGCMYVYVTWTADSEEFWSAQPIDQ